MVRTARASALASAGNRRVLTAYPPGAVIEHGSCGECCACLHLCCCKLGCKMVMVKPRSEMAEKAFGSKALKDARTDLKRYWVLESMSVDPAFQSKGVGTALLGAITHLAKNDGAPMVVEFVGDRLKGFYGRRGFAVPDTFYELKDGDDAIKVYAGVWNPGAGAGAAGNQGTYARGDDALNFSLPHEYSLRV